MELKAACKVISQDPYSRESEFVVRQRACQFLTEIGHSPDRIISITEIERSDHVPNYRITIWYWEKSDE